MKTITKFTAAALLAMSAVAPALAFEPEAQQFAERNTYASAMGHDQAYGAHAQVIGAQALPIEPEARQLAERDAYQDQALDARAQADAVIHSRAGTRR